MAFMSAIVAVASAAFVPFVAGAAFPVPDGSVLPHKAVSDVGPGGMVQYDPLRDE